MITITKAHFKDNENTKWTPNKNHHTALMYTEATQREPYNNQTQNERTSMKDLSEREDIIITKGRQRWCRSFCGCKRQHKSS